MRGGSDQEGLKQDARRRCGRRKRPLATHNALSLRWRGRRNPEHCNSRNCRHGERGLVETLLLTKAMWDAKTGSGRGLPGIVARRLAAARRSRYRVGCIVRTPVTGGKRQGCLRQQKRPKDQTGTAQQGTTLEHGRILA